MTLDEKISKYGKEFRYLTELTDDELIASHRELRLIHQKQNQEQNKTLDEARRDAEEKIIEYAKNNNMYTIEQLRNLTVSELVNILSYGEG